MAETLMFVPASEAEGLVREWRARYDPSCSAGVPAHITILYPFRHPDLVDDVLISDLTSLFSVHSPFSYRLTRIGRFPAVTHLVPEPPDPFVALTGAVAKRYPDCPPYWGLYGEVVPHCTVAHTDDDAVHEAIEMAVTPALPVRGRATEVVLMQEREGAWTFRARFPLGASGAGG